MDGILKKIADFDGRLKEKTNSYALLALYEMLITIVDILNSIFGLVE